MRRKHPRDEVLIRYVDGEATKRERKRGDAYVKECGECRAMAELKAC